MEEVAIILPVDVVTSEELKETSSSFTKSVNDVLENELILDVGPKTAQLCSKILSQSQTIIWNGPLGVFEIDAFSKELKRYPMQSQMHRGFLLLVEAIQLQL